MEESGKSQILTAEELERIGCLAFEGMESEVSRLWIDWMGDRPFVRICLWRGVTKRGVARMRRLRKYLETLTRLEFVGVIYPVDLKWEEIEAISARMRELE